MSRSKPHATVLLSDYFFAIFFAQFLRGYQSELKMLPSRIILFLDLDSDLAIEVAELGLRNIKQKV